MKYSIVKRILALTFASSLILTGCTGENPVPGTAGVDTGANTAQANSDSTDKNPAVDSAYSDSADSSDSDLTADAASTEAYTSGKYPITWNIDAVYKNDEEFLKDGELIKGWISKLSDYKGTLSDASSIKEFYELIWDDDIRAVYGRMMTYVNMRLTMDSSDTKAGELDALLSEYDSGFIAATAFADDEIFTMEPAKRATVFGDRIFDDMTFLREKFANESDSHHSEDAINLMGKISNASGYGLKAYNEFLNNSFPYCNYTLPDGRTVPLTAASRQYIAAGSDYDRDVKIEVYDAYYQNLTSSCRIRLLYHHPK